MHAAYTQMAARHCVWIKTDAVVGDSESQSGRVSVQGHPARARLAMLDHVVQGLLSDAVDSNLHVGRQERQRLGDQLDDG